jgi:hypothetical protein
VSDLEPGRLITSALVAFQREYEAELQVAFDKLSDLGWPPGRLILASSPVGVNRSYQILIKHGIEMSNDMPVFMVKTAIGGGSLRYWCGWMLPPEHLPVPSPRTVEMGELAEASWKRRAFVDGATEDERQTSETSSETILRDEDGKTLMTWVDEWSNLTPEALQAVLESKS